MHMDLGAAPGVPTVLYTQRQHELDTLFSSLPTPARSLEGCWRGRLMAIRGFGWLPRVFARMLYALLGTPLNPWSGKSFANGTGANRWFGVRGAAFGRFRVVEQAMSPVDQQPVVWLDYDVPENPRLLRHIRGEARQLGNGLILARMNWKTQRGLYRVLYFTLVPG
ncbi:hypothetical protein E4T66_05215 [Sinimarinibacterium sp. CAU 1509]|uniref:hypothetical protein n=1 Tax=Sinimarinibacterium sp. CAU 1509 TaxID=2562283 RepID=UPI0010AB8E3A|nr:hypothetical protein [Sinimarinibacterium sp. CAU 1509]TJY63112.1 hypothetical protein E4T66_05215 [Sinimarinibacterium sp. CAU 1509]